MAVTSIAIVDAGRNVVERSGWECLSLRAVAAELGVTPMALYRHVEHADALSALVLESIIDDTAGVEHTGDLAGDLASWARAFRTSLARFDGVAGWLLTHWFESPAMLERVEGLLELSAEHDIDGFDAVAVTNAVFTYVVMRCEAERVVRTGGAVRRALRTSGTSRPLPRLTALVAYYATAEFDTHFEYGLHALIGGLLARVLA